MNLKYAPHGATFEALPNGSLVVTWPPGRREPGNEVCLTGYRERLPRGERRITLERWAAYHDVLAALPARDAKELAAVTGHPVADIRDAIVQLQQEGIISRGLRIIPPERRRVWRALDKHGAILWTFTAMDGICAGLLAGKRFGSRVDKVTRDRHGACM